MINAFLNLCNSYVRDIYILFNTSLTIIYGIYDNGFDAVYCIYNSWNKKRQGAISIILNHYDCGLVKD